MTDDGPEPTAAERRLDEHLELLRVDPSAGDPALVAHVVRRARWQRILRTPVQVVASLGGAAVDGLRALIGTRGRSAR